MTTDVHATKTYYCPKCGKKHAADFTPLEGHPEIHGKVHCTKCNELLWLSLDEEGDPRAEVYQEHVHEARLAHKEGAAPEPTQPLPAPMAASGPVAASATPAPPAAARSPSWVPPLVAAALVAAVVSYVVGQAGSGGEAKAQPAPAKAAARAPDPAFKALEATVAAARNDLAALGEQVEGLRTELASVRSAQDAAVQGAAQTGGRLREALEALGGRFEALEGKYGGLNGRIEANYTSLRKVEKLLEAK